MHLGLALLNLDLNPNLKLNQIYSHAGGHRAGSGGGRQQRVQVTPACTMHWCIGEGSANYVTQLAQSLARSLACRNQLQSLETKRSWHGAWQCHRKLRLPASSSGAPARTHMQRCCRRDLQQLAAEVEALRGQMGDDADRYSEGLAGSDESTQSADAAGHPDSEADALDEPRVGPDARAPARRLAELEGALGRLAADQESAHGQVSAGLACVMQQLDSLQVWPLSKAAMHHAAECWLAASQAMLAADTHIGTACMRAMTL